MRREFHVRFSEGGGVKLPSATRLVILCRTREEADAALAEVRAWVSENGLVLHPEKTHVGDCRQPGQGFEFLGYRFEAGQRHVRQKSLNKVSLDEETTDWRAVCGTTARTVRREGSAKADPYPYQGRPGTVSLGLMSAAVRAPARLEQEPGAALHLVDEGFEQAGGPGVAVVVAELVRLAHGLRHGAVVRFELLQHRPRRDEGLVIVVDRLQPADMTDRTQRRLAELAHPLLPQLSPATSRRQSLDRPPIPCSIFVHDQFEQWKSGAWPIGRRRTARYRGLGA